MLKALRLVQLIMGIILILVAVFVILTPQLQLRILGFFLAGAVLLSGLYDLLRYFVTPATQRNAWGIVRVIISVVLGVFLFAGSAQASYIPILVGVWLIFISLVQLVFGGGRQYMGHTSVRRKIQWGAWIALVLGILTVIFPVFFGTLAVWLIGLCLLGAGVYCLVSYFMASRGVKNPPVDQNNILDL